MGASLGWNWELGQNEGLAHLEGQQVGGEDEHQDDVVDQDDGDGGTAEPEEEADAAARAWRRHRSVHR